MTAETKRTACSSIHFAAYAGIRRIVKVAAVFNIRLVKIDCRRNKTFLNCLYAEQCFNRACRTDHMTGFALRRRNMQFVCIIPKDAFKHPGFRNVICNSGSSVRIIVLNFLRLHFCILKRKAHSHCTAGTVFKRSRNMIRIA